MTLGAGTFVPQGQFNFPRSYVAGVWLSFDTGSLVSWFTNRVTFLDPSHTVFGTILFAPEFWDWSSNVYSMDFLILESWYSFPPSPVEIPLPFRLIYYLDPLDNVPYFVYQPFSAIGTGAFKHLLPPAPPTYWRPTQ